MVIALKLTRVGNSVGVILPPDALARMAVEEGDVLYLAETPDGYRLTSHEPGFEHQMTAARTVMKNRRNVLSALAT